MILYTETNGVTHICSEKIFMMLAREKLTVWEPANVAEAIERMNNRFIGGAWQQDTEYIEGVREP